MSLLERYIQSVYSGKKYEAWCTMLMQAYDMRALVVLLDGVDEAAGLRDQIENFVHKEIVPSGNRVAPPAYEAGWKDTVQVDPDQIVRVIARFEDYTGLFPYHCHILEHEDEGCMTQMQIVKEKGDRWGYCLREGVIVPSIAGITMSVFAACMAFGLVLDPFLRRRAII